MFDLWEATIWLPGNFTWADLRSDENIRFPQRDEFFYYGAVATVCMLILRISIESFVFVPLAWVGGWIREPLVPRMFQHFTGGFAGKSKLKRVAECAWRFSYYVFSTIFGIYALSGQPQVSSVVECWKGWPRHNLPDAIWWYYIVEAAFYQGLLISQLFFDVRRSDFLQMLLHHVVTVFLLFISWNMNMIRVGALIILCHDVGDVFLELTKLFRYARWQRMMELNSIVFVAIWVASRNIYFPFWIVHSIWFDAPALIQDSYRWGDLSQRPLMPRILLVLLTALIFLHVLWTALIIRIIYNSVAEGKDLDDEREESDAESDTEDSAEKITRKKKE